MQRHKLLFLTIVTVLLFTGLASPSSATAFTFGAAGDYAFGSNFTATVTQVDQHNVDFHLSLGDNSYSSGKEQSWCNTWTSKGVNIYLIAGNHDVGESSGGNIDSYRTYCPFNLAGLNGDYGKRYYFDYPPTNPTTRFIMVTPGVKGSISNLNTFTIGGAGYTFTSQAIDDARAKGIKWIVVGMHKNYISVLEKSNEVGTDFMNLLFTKKVDLVLQGHEHGYERTKQLTCAPTNTFQASCVVDSDNIFTKGAGVVIAVLGTGGQGVRGLNAGDAEYPYFAIADNTTYGFGKFTVTENQLSYTFVRSAGGTLQDSFSIDSTQTQPTITPTPTLLPTASPTPLTISPTPLSCGTPPLDKGMVTLSASVTTTGVYKIWTRMMAPDTTNNSYYLQIDNECPVVIGDSPSLPSQSWQWVPTNDTIELDSGTHVVKLIGKESGVRIDKLLLSANISCTPTELGDNCTAVTVTPTHIPTAIITPTPTPTSIPTATPTKQPSITPTPTNQATNTITLQALADTFINTERPDTNYGTSTALEVDGEPTKMIYMKYDLAPLSARIIKTAKLRFYVKDSSSSTQTIRLVENTSWGERTLTANNRHRVSTILGTINGGRSGRWVEVDLTEAVKSRVGLLFSFRIDSTGENGLDFYSKESSADRRPVLVVTY